jgi:hypothetical protein
MNITFEKDPYFDKSGYVAKANNKFLKDSQNKKLRFKDVMNDRLVDYLQEKGFVRKGYDFVLNKR